MTLYETLRTAEAFPNRVGQRLNRLSPRARWFLYGLGIIVLSLLVWHFVAVLFAPPKKAPPAPPVRIAVAQRRDVSVMVNTIGMVVSPAMVQVTAQVTGKLHPSQFPRRGYCSQRRCSIPDRPGAL